MEVSSIKNSTDKIHNIKLRQNICCNPNNTAKIYHISKNSKVGKKISFGAVSAKLMLSKLCNNMVEISETKNAFITMVGTGLIAPFAIMCSPKKPCKHPGSGEEKKDWEKKFFQAVRQPISAILAFGFQMVSIFGINKALNYGAYKAHWGIFKDEGLKNLIPDENYLRKQATKILKGKASSELNAEWADEIKIVKNEEQMKAGLKERIRAEYDDVGVTLDKATLEKEANNKRALRKFKIDKMIEVKQEKLKAAKVQELLADLPKDIDTELITEKYQKKVRELYGSEIINLDKNANLKWYDKLLNNFGIKTKKVKSLEKAKAEFMQTKGLELVKKKMGDSFNDTLIKLKAYVDIRTSKAQKMFKAKLFWISLATNLVTVALSCVALNWLHPKLAAFIDKCRGKNIKNTASTEKKVEVSK